MKSLLFIVLALSFTFYGCWEKKTIWLDKIAFDEILDPYGPPKRNVNFALDSMRLGDINLERGLGTHAPSTLNIDLNGKGNRFEALIGIDAIVQKYHTRETRRELEGVPNYVYDNNVDHYDYTKGGTAVFKVFLDGELKFNSGLMTVESIPAEISINLRKAKKLSLVVEASEDGSFADYADWGMARLTMTGNTMDLKIHHHATDILVNHAGFLPSSFKTCYGYGIKPIDFHIIDIQNREAVYTGHFVPKKGDLGKYLVGDFSDFMEPGKYFIESENMKSEVFEIGEDTYGDCLQKHIKYINLQRSGHETEGWAPGNHVDDGVRDDNRKHQDVSGGWYDACDLRKPAKGNSLLLFALATLAESGTSGIPDSNLLAEIKWGNKFLLSMQDPDGHLMHYIGFTWEGLRENHWTDNIIGTEDDRTILTRPTDINTHLVFIAAECKIARKFEKMDLAYASRCKNAARNAYNWTIKEGDIKNHEDVGLAITVATEMFKTFRKVEYMSDAENFLNELLNMQNNQGPVINGYFFEIGEGGTKEGGLAMMGLADFIKTFPDHPKSGEAREAMRRFADNYYKIVAGTNAFSIIPWIISEDTLSGGKRIGPYWYKNFLHVGINQHLSRNGAGLVAAAEILNEPEYARIGQRQLDWIYGANPFNASTVNEIGYNQPALFKTTKGEYRPHTPELTGGVMTGIGSDPYDNITLFPGWWWTTEYWSPTVTYTMILADKLAVYNGMK